MAVVVGAVLAWALATKVFPSLDPDAERIARLQEPVGYWNALALLADVAVVLGLWLGATERQARRPCASSARSSRTSRCSRCC